jgi:signal transduction histidine kinase
MTPAAPAAELPSPLTAASNVAHQRAPADDHGVQLYESDDFMCGLVADYARAGLDAGEPVVLVATQAHAHSILARLTRSDDVTEALAAQRLTVLEARETLERFMVDGVPDRARFAEVVDGLVGALRFRTATGRVRVFGEMVDVLLREGNPEAALRLESLWNEAARRHPITLLCAYLMGSFYKESHAGHLRRICAAHAHVSPTESFPRDGSDEVQLREVALLQQRAQALESEVAHRKEIEQRLREALSQRRRVEDALRAREEELRRQNEELTRTVRFSEMFVGILGHDLRNPLSAITTAASLLARRAESEKVAAPTGRILNSARRMARMIDQLLDFTRIRLGNGLPLERRRTDLADVCRSVVEELETATHEKRVRLEACGDLAGTWDGDRLAQLASNLLSNALAHGDAGAPITLRLEGSGDYVLLEVHNAGAISGEVLPLIFDPFKSGADRKQERSSGLGLGLFITREIALAHAGSIGVESSPEEGTRFTVRLPREPGASGPAFSSQENVAGGSADGTRHR